MRLTAADVSRDPFSCVPSFFLLLASLGPPLQSSSAKWVRFPLRVDLCELEEEEGGVARTDTRSIMNANWLAVVRS